MCPPDYHYNGFVATHALGHMMHGYIITRSHYKCCKKFFQRWISTFHLRPSFMKFSVKIETMWRSATAAHRMLEILANHKITNRLILATIMSIYATLEKRRLFIEDGKCRTEKKNYKFHIWSP